MWYKFYHIVLRSRVGHSELLRHVLKETVGVARPWPRVVEAKATNFSLKEKQNCVMDLDYKVVIVNLLPN